VPVFRNRFAAARFVFIFGISTSPLGFNFYRIYVKIDGVSIEEFRLTPPEKSFNWNYARLALPCVLKTD